MRNLRLALLGLAALAAVLLGAAFLQRALQSDESPVAAAIPPTAALPPVRNAALAAPRARVEAALATAPDYVRFFDRLRLAFPSDHDAILDALAQSSVSGGKMPSVDSIMADAVGALRKAQGGLATHASDQALGQIFALQLQEMRSLAERDVHLCVAFLYGASNVGFLGYAADHRALIADAAIAGLDAMSSGRMDQIQRAAPTDSDFQSLDKALTDRGMARPEIEALLDGKNADPPIPYERMCRAGQIYLETMASLSAPSRARLYGLAVDLMGRS